MKAVVDKENWKITLDNEAIKAIRFCYGVNTDLRVRLGIPKDRLWSWIYDNRYGLFGDVMAEMNPTYKDDDWDKFERMLNNVVKQITR